MANSDISSEKAVAKFKSQAKMAASILGGQAVAAQTNSMVIPKILQNQSPTTKQIAKAGIPLALGVALGLTFQSSITRGVALGFGTQGVLEAIKLVMPDFSPQQGLGFGDPSHYVYTDEDGNQQVVMTPPQQQEQLPAAEQAPQSSFQGEDELQQSGFAEDVEYV